MYDLNIKERLNKIETILNMWSSRYLSLKGKITVLKSLVLPHVIQLVNIIYLNDSIQDKLDKMFFNLLWSNRKHGIKKDVLTNPIEKGGLKMICIKTMIRSINITWIKRLTNDINAKWKALSWHFLNIEKDFLFTKLNFKDIHCPQTEFYTQLLNSWFSFIKIEPKNKNDVLNEFVANNCDITINCKPINQNFGLTKNLKIKHIYNIEDNKFLNIEDIKSRNSISLDTLKYNQLISAIPNKWKTILKNNVGGEISKFHKMIYQDKNLSKVYNRDIYNYIISIKDAIPSSQNKWTEYYPFLEKINWSEIYKLPYEICKDSYIQSLQFKIIHRYINCNENLFKWQLKDNNKCEKCDKPDNLEHYFFYCEEIFQFWENLALWIGNTTEITIGF